MKVEPAVSVPAALVLVSATRGTAWIGLFTEAVQDPLHTPVAGGVTVAVLVTVPVAVTFSLAVMLYTTWPPTGKVAMVSFSAALPEATGHTAPPLAVQVQLQLAMPAGSGSATTAPLAGALPLLVAVTV